MKNNSTHSEEKLTCYDALIAKVDGIKRKGTTLPYTSLTGNMFSYLERDGSFELRLPETDREAFLKKYKTSLFMSFGMVMKEYVLVPEKLFRNTRELAPLKHSNQSHQKRNRSVDGAADLKIN
jgi:hypothetical protein